MTDDLPDIADERRSRRNVVLLGAGALAATVLTASSRREATLDQSTAELVDDAGSRASRALSRRYLDVAERGAPGGVAGLDESGTVTTSSGSPLQPRDDQDVATLVVTAERFPGLDPSGENDSADAINAAVRAVPFGGTIVLPPGRYRLDSAIENLDDEEKPKSVRIVGYGAVLVQSGGDPTFHLRGLLESVYDIEGEAKTLALRTEALSETAAPVQAVTVTLANRLPDGTEWRRGDIVKLVADDPAVGSRYANANSANVKRSAAGEALFSRVGQFLSVYSVDGVEVTLLGELRDPFTTNLRIARLSDVSTELRGLILDTSDEIQDDDGHRQSHVLHYSLRRPVVADVTVRRGNGSAFSMISCFGYRIESVTVQYLRNSPRTGNYGYGVLDCQSYAGHVVSSVFREVRHAFTSIPDTMGERAAMYRYGRTYGTVIESSICENPTSAAWSTHHGSESVTFLACHAVGARGGFGLRGRFHRILDCHVRDSDTAVGLRVDPNTGPGPESYGHLVDGLTAQNVYTVIAADMYSGQRPSTFRNVVAAGIREYAVRSDRGNLRIRSSEFVFAARAAETQTAPITLDRTATLDLRDVDIDVTAWNDSRTGAPAVIDTGDRGDDTQTVSARGLRVLAPDEVFDRFCRSTENTTLDVDATSSGSFATGFGPTASTTASVLDVRVVPTGASTSVLSASGERMQDAALADDVARSAAPVIDLMLDPDGSDRSPTGLRRPRFAGQRIALSNVGSRGDVVLRASDDASLDLGGDELAVGPGRALTLLGVSAGERLAWRALRSL